MKHKLTISTLLLLALFSARAPAAFASTTWYVNGVSGSDGNNCKSPTSACKTIGRVISLAASGDTVMVTTATYSENLTLSKSLKILGSSAQTTIIDGGNINTVVTISNSAAQVTLSQMTIRHGSALRGGGIYNSGTLTINHCVVSGNDAGHAAFGGTGGGIYSPGNLTIDNSTIQGNSASSGIIPGGGGGGIYAGGLTTINNSTISGNSAIRAAGIEAWGSTTINNSTISANSAYGTGQGCGHHGCPGLGGGIYAGGSTTINNSTISGNSASNQPQGGGIYGSATFQNSIVANNTGGGNCSGTMTSHGYNMSSDGTCNFHNSGDRNNITNPKLGTLGNYGGPTQTIPLLSGSPAIDAGNPSGCTDGSGHLLKTDQRGYPRPDKEDSGGCDMGAFEKQSD